MASVLLPSNVWFLAFGLLTWRLCIGIGADTDAGMDGAALQALASDWQPGPASWFGNSGGACTSNGIRCVGNRIVQISISAKLSGTLNSQIFRITELMELDLADNNFSGSLPESVSNKLEKLVKLDLANNRFSGNIPDFFASVPPLVNLNLSYNNFSGSLPSSLTNFQCSSFMGNPYLNKTGCKADPQVSVENSSPVSLSLVGIILGSIFGLLLFLGLSLFTYFRYFRKQDSKPEPPLDTEDPPLAGYAGRLRRYSLGELESATCHFSRAYLVGEGGASEVYKGVVGGTEETVAIKRLRVGGRRRSALAEAEFVAEVRVMSRAIHRRLLRVEGFCVEKRERIIVGPFMTNGSVADRLDLGPDSPLPPLDWSVRRKVALGTAEGLSYLHESCDPKIIHRDIKAANVLLSARFEAVVADFGLAREGDTRGRGGDEQRVRGTYGYLAPEYIASGTTSEKTDVYAYGVFLLELLSGSSIPKVMKHPEKEERGLSLRDWVALLWQEKRVVNELLDPFLVSTGFQETEMELFLQTALECLQTQPSLRPTMSSCSYLLEGPRVEQQQRRVEWDVGKVRLEEDESGRPTPGNYHGYDSQQSFSFGNFPATSPR